MTDYPPGSGCAWTFAILMAIPLGFYRGGLTTAIALPLFIIFVFILVHFVIDPMRYGD